MQDWDDATEDAADGGETSARVSIVGGGITGSGVLIRAVDHYEEMLRDDPAIPPLQIDWFDSTGAFGVGMPYDLETFVFRLNQPASRMSIHNDRSGHFIEWLKKQDEAKRILDVAKARLEIKKYQKAGLSENQIAYLHPKTFELATSYDRNSFVPRAVYKRYMQDQLEEVKKRVGIINSQLDRKAITINPHTWRVEGMEPPENSNTIQISAGEAGHSDPSHIVRAHAVALATGHQKSDLFEKFEGNPDYTATPIHDVADVKKLVGDNLNPDEPLFILGTSQSMLDALGALDAIGYEGKIIAASTNGIEPWPFDPAKHMEDRIDYPLKYVTKENIQKLKDQHPGNSKRIALGLYDLVSKELHDSQAIDQGVHHVISTLLSKYGEFCMSFKESDPEIYKGCVQIVHEFEGNSTLPDRYETFKEYKDSGQLQIMRARVNVNTTTTKPGKKGFSVMLEDPVEGTSEKIPVAKFINCAAFTRTPYTQNKETGYIKANDPVTQMAIDNGMVIADPKTKELHANPKATVLVEPVGPTSTAGWGVPYTKASFDTVAQGLVRHAVMIAQNQSVLRSPTPAENREWAP